MPDAIDRALATTLALERVVTVLKEHFPAKLAARAAQLGGVSIDAPEPEHYYLPGGYPDRQVYHAPVVVEVSQHEREVVDVRESGDAGTEGEVINLPVRVKLMFHRDAWTPLDRVGHPQTHAEHLSHLARVYYGALLDTLYERLRDGVAVSNLQTTAGDHSVSSVGEQMRAGCYVELLIKQSVRVPKAIYT